MATTISSKIILDSINSNGDRITTLHMRYPRFIHAELMTHRVFSRNARSSRAVPVQKMIDEIMNDPVIPLYWGKNQKGMQASEECDELVMGMNREEAWLWARDNAVDAANGFMNAGYHKQVVNRILEPFMHIDTLVTATDWKNFFFLRNHKDAEPHIRDLAIYTQEVMEDSEPVLLTDEWHLPYVMTQDREDISDGETLAKISAARCARISYSPFDGNASTEAELERFEKLNGIPKHASPMEHQAYPDPKHQLPHLHGNLRGWVQFRKTIPHESVME